MKSIPHWVLWKLEKRDGSLTKVPYQINGRKADSTKKDNWATFEQAMAVYNSSTYFGLGFVLTRDTGFVVVDFDHVRHDSISPVDGSTSKEWDEGVFTEIQNFNSYAEISQSGEGAHVFCKGNIVTDGKKKGNLEMYCNKIFFAITGDHIAETPKTVNEAQECIDVYYQLWFEGYETTNNSNNIQSPIMDMKT